MNKLPNIHPGDVLLKEFLEPMALSQNALARATGVPPANRLEALKGDRRGQYSIRINDQWRICFRWADGDAHDVQIVDCH